MSEADAIQFVARERAEALYIDTSVAEELEAVVQEVSERVSGFGSDVTAAVRDGIARGLISVPETDDPLTVNETVDVLLNAGILDVHETPYGVLITDFN